MNYYSNRWILEWKSDLHHLNKNRTVAIVIHNGFYNGFYEVATASTRFLQRLRWYTGEWPTKQELNFLVFCRNAGPPLPNKSCNHQLLQLLHGFYRGSDCILENGPQNKKLNFLVFCRNARPPLPNKSYNHPCRSGARCTDRYFQSEEMCSKKDPPPKKLNFLVVYNDLP